MEDPRQVPSRFQLRVKTGTAVSTGLALAALLLFDWDKATGHKTVFSGIRPALRSALNRVYGVQPAEPEPEAAEGGSAAQQGGQR